MSLLLLVVLPLFLVPVQAFSTCGSSGALTFCLNPNPYHQSDKYLVLSYSVSEPQAANVSFVGTLALNRHHYIVIEIPASLSGSFTLAPKSTPGSYMATGYLWQVDHAIARVDLILVFGRK